MTVMPAALNDPSAAVGTIGRVAVADRLGNYSASTSDQERSTRAYRRFRSTSLSLLRGLPGRSERGARLLWGQQHANDDVEYQEAT
jgi:hypothetical protein